MNAEDQLHALKRRLIRDEIARRNPLDVDAVEALVGFNFAIASDGRIVAHSPEGGALVGNGAGLTKDISEALDDLAKARPTLFPSGPAPAGKGDSETNPFSRETFNLTAQMVIRRSDPARAEHLEYLASIGGR